MPALLALTGDLRGESILLEDEVFSIGRADRNQLALDDCQISGSHCGIIRQGQIHILKDYDSTNGTVVNGQVIEEVELDHGDIIHIGTYEFRFVADTHFDELDNSPSTITEIPFSDSELRKLDVTQPIDITAKLAKLREKELEKTKKKAEAKYNLGLGDDPEEEEDEEEYEYEDIEVDALESKAIYSVLSIVSIVALAVLLLVYVSML